MSSLLGVGVGEDVYPHGYRWGNTSCNLLCCCRLQVPLDTMAQKDGVPGKISIWGKSRERVNSRGDWSGCMILLDMSVTRHWWTAAGKMIFLSAGCPLPPKAWGFQPSPHLATPWLKKAHVWPCHWSPGCRFLFWVISSCLRSVSELLLPDFHCGTL